MSGRRAYLPRGSRYGWIETLLDPIHPLNCVRLHFTGLRRRPRFSPRPLTRIGALSLVVTKLRRQIKQHIRSTARQFSTSSGVVESAPCCWDLFIINGRSSGRGQKKSIRCRSRVGERFPQEVVSKVVEKGSRNEATGARSSPKPIPGSQEMASKIPVWLDVDTGTWVAVLVLKAHCVGG